ncbi:hypothetical protein [Piscirickettsia salmonis]|nr:hypothetical protein [Piscirickettsia salmonis]QNR81523.1 hypothetical protein ICC15_06215 [Piscirickettsia salmonis]WGZ71571.1 hypothetical protein E3220_07980 [Piscirickettsia salmonis EM-90]
MAEIMKAILANGDEIAFATTGPLSKDRIHTFFQTEYGINLPADFQFYNQTADKTESLKQIAESRRVAYENVILIDNAKMHIELALDFGFSVIPVDTNNVPDNPVYGVDTTNGTLYIQELEIIVNEQTRLNARAEGGATEQLPITRKEWFKRASRPVLPDDNHQVVLLLDLDESIISTTPKLSYKRTLTAPSNQAHYSQKLYVDEAALQKVKALQDNGHKVKLLTSNTYSPYALT